MEAQNAIDQQNAVDIQIDGDDNQPVAPSRRRKDDRRGGGEKTEEELEDEAQDILERLKKLWARQNWISPLLVGLYICFIRNSTTNNNNGDKNNNIEADLALCDWYLTATKSMRVDGNWKNLIIQFWVKGEVAACRNDCETRKLWKS